MDQQKTNALLLAAATATLFLAGCASQSGGSQAAAEAVIHCGGVTSCKGTSDCKTATNACKGQNSCKGQGFKALTASECATMGGHEV